MTANDDLQERVEQLEETVAAQNQTIKKMLPNRRQTMAGIGAVLGGAALGGTASGSTGDAGQVGVSTDRPDVTLDAVDANSVSAGKTTHTVTESAGSTDLFAAIVSENEPTISDGVQTTTSVSDSTTTIYSLSAVDNRLAGLVLVQGSDGDASPNEGFADIVLAFRGSGATQVASVTDNAHSRSYTVSGNDVEITLGNTGSYEIRARTIEFGRAQG